MSSLITPPIAMPCVEYRSKRIYIRETESKLCKKKKEPEGWGITLIRK
jgi:hypothetical protein